MELPSATRAAPVSVARSTMRSGASTVVRVGERVGEHQPALRVGVEHLDRPAAVVGDDVPHPHRGAGRHVLRRRHQAGDPDRAAEPASADMARDHRGPAGHVGLHGLHAVVGLQRQPAAVERDALADQHHVPARLGGCAGPAAPAWDTARVIAELDQPGRLGRPRADARAARRIRPRPVRLPARPARTGRAPRRPWPPRTRARPGS